MFLKGVTSTTKKTFLNRLLQPAAQRAFSLNSVQAFVNAAETTQAAESKDFSSFSEKDFQKLQKYS